MPPKRVRVQGMPLADCTKTSAARLVVLYFVAEPRGVPCFQLTDSIGRFLEPRCQHTVRTPLLGDLSVNQSLSLLVFGHVPLVVLATLKSPLKSRTIDFYERFLIEHSFA